MLVVLVTVFLALAVDELSEVESQSDDEEESELKTSVADMSELKKETPISLAILESPSEIEDQKKCKPIPDLDPSASVVSSVNIFNNN